MKSKSTAKKPTVQVKDLKTRKSPKGGAGYPIYTPGGIVVVAERNAFPVGSSIGTTRK